MVPLSLSYSNRYLVSAVPGLKVDGSSPVVGKILVELAACAGGKTRNVCDWHGCVECILPETDS